MVGVASTHDGETIINIFIIWLKWLMCVEIISESKMSKEFILKWKLNGLKIDRLFWDRLLQNFI